MIATTLGAIDWVIVLVLFLIMLAGVFLSRGQMKSVADFLAAGRTAGRYLVSVGGGIAGLGAITIVGLLEMNYEAGFAMSWWGLTMGVFVLVVTASGWVIYRFRQTRCMTLAEFFERRYSRGFRIFAGMVVFGSGVVNFGIFPAVGARFFIHYCGFPVEVQIAGLAVSTFPLVMAALLSISLLFVFAGGQIAVILTDFVQGFFVNVVFVVVVIYLITRVSWDQTVVALASAPKEASLLNPFDTKNIPDYNVWYFIIGLVGYLYSTMSWQGTQAYNVSAESAHEAKMGGVLGMWRGIPQGLFLLFVPIVIYTMMHHADFESLAGQVESRLTATFPDDPIFEKDGTPALDDEGNPKVVDRSALRNQMRSPVVLSRILPVGLLGAFAAVMFAAFISTHDTYLHSWGSVFVQDVVLPIRGRPVSKKAHLWLLRLSILGVALFIFGWSIVFQQSRKIFLYFAITGAIFAGGSGTVIIGGLYTRWGKARGAFGALIVGATLAVGHIVLHEVAVKETMAAYIGHAIREGVTPGPATGTVLQQIGAWFYFLNGQEVWALTMGTAVLAYVSLSLIGPKSRFDLDRLLRRGPHSTGDEVKVVSPESDGWRLLGMGREFTPGDKALYLVTYVWTGLWTLVFFVGTAWNLISGWSDSAWARYWQFYVFLQIVLSIVVIGWFGLGGILDIRAMFRRLKERVRSDRDDGFVEDGEDS